MERASERCLTLGFGGGGGQRAAALQVGPHVRFLGAKGGDELKALQMACGERPRACAWFVRARVRASVRPSVSMRACLRP